MAQARRTLCLVALAARAAWALTLASDPIATKYVMPEPVTEAACLACEKNITDMREGISSCNSAIALVNNIGAGAVADLKQQRANATGQEEAARLEVDAYQRNLLRAQARQAPLYDELGRQFRGVAGQALSLAAVEPEEPDYVGRWLRCNTRRTSVELNLNSCFQRLLSEKRRQADREAHYAMHVSDAKAALNRTQERKVLVVEAFNKTDAENRRIETNIESLRAAVAAL
mmetsp:Transcript_95757/g.206637  ORF Transcript_95757/g.206637 Transcript_95757/m.206637 type:complete len:230 (+) Transcript_95757:83-772(+)